MSLRGYLCAQILGGGLEAKTVVAINSDDEELERLKLEKA